MTDCDQPVQALVPPVQELMKSLQKKFPNAEFRLSLRSPHFVQRKYGQSWLAMCPHGLKSQCKICGGVLICEHSKQRHNCRVCGIGFCTHGKTKGRCRTCKGSEFCIHQVRKYDCKICKGSSICEHSNLRLRCRICAGSQICIHKLIKYNCGECCGEEAACEHGRPRMACLICGGVRVCPCGEHFKVRSGLCAHCLKCASDGCIGSVSQAFDYQFCNPCGRFNTGRTPQKKRQDQVFDFIEKTYPKLAIRYDLIIPDQNCTKVRPDVLFRLPHRKLIIEVDENSHKSTSYDCETKRMSDIASAGDVLPTVFIRYNPDLYRDHRGTTRKIPSDKRLERLQEEIDRWLDPEKEQPHFITVVYLYYDKCEEREENFIPCDWQEQILKKELESGTEMEPSNKRVKLE